MIVGLATSVVELDGAVSDHDRVVIVDHVVRACSVGRDEVRGRTAHSEIAAYATELACVDQDVPVVGVAVSLESGVDVAVTDHGHVAVSGGEVGAAAYVIGVAMRVHQMRYRSVVPCANGGDHIAARPSVRRIERDETVAGVEHHGVAETLDDSEPVGHFGQLVGDPIDRFVDSPRIDHPG